MTVEEKLIRDIREKLSDHRYTHSLNVAKSARELSLRYGADPQKAYLAGLGHDILKEQPKEEALAYFSMHGITLTEVEKNAPKLWHAITSAVYLRENYGFDAELENAVRYHTTGRENMTLLEKILFVADFISEERSYNGVEDMRERAKLSLEHAMAEGLRFTVWELSENGAPIHPDTVHCYNQIILSERNR